MTSSRLGVGILGLGSIGHTHALAIAELADDAVLVGATHTTLDELTALGFPRARAYVDEESLLADPAVDVVVIASPSQLHARQTVAALDSGKHVVVEKPIALDDTEVAQVTAAVARTDRVVSVMAQRRFEPQHVKLRELLRSGELGRLVLAEAFVHWYRSDEYYHSAPWRALSPGGGSLMNQALHSVDLLDWLVGPIVEVTGYTATLRHAIDAEDSAAVAVRFTDGGLGLIASTTAANFGDPAELAIRTTRGTIELAQSTITRWEVDGVPKPGTASAGVGGANDPSAIGIAGHVAQWRDIAEAVRTGRTPIVSADDGLRTVRIIDAIYSSARTGRSVEVGR